MNKIKKYSIEEDEFIRKNYEIMSPRQIGEKLGRTKSAIKNRVNTLGLKLDRSSLCINRLGQFRKGHIPLNKGQKMSPEVREKVKHTWFTKGHKPKNTKEGTLIFSHRKDSNGNLYRHIKISDSNWILYHRYLYEQHFGLIPSGMNVVFKDGNTLNVEIENLELISNEELMKRNTIHRFPEELKEVIRLNSKLIRKTNNHGKKQNQ